MDILQEIENRIHGIIYGSDSTAYQPCTASAAPCKVSVAMATYNGEKYIEQQLVSICLQTRKPDEIVISDDGSTDATLEIIEKVANSTIAEGIDFIVIHDNPRHGYCGNFEWALRHTSGDYIFLSDQDDVWLSEKVSQMLKVFQFHPDARCVCHNAVLIGKSGEQLDGIFDNRLSEGNLNVPEGMVAKFDRAHYLEKAVSWPSLHGMSFCISAKLRERCIPFPKCNGFHDKWINFLAILDDGCYCLNLPLALYRLHGNNAAGNSAYHGNLIDVATKRWKKLLNTQPQTPDYLFMGQAITEKLQENGQTATQAHKTAHRLIEIGSQLYIAETSSKIVGILLLFKLFCTDMRYRCSGTGAFLYGLAFIMLHSRTERIKIIGGDI